MKIPSTRAEAQTSGSSKYFTGKPCTNGHVEIRYTSSGSCRGCIRGNNVDTRYGSQEQYEDFKLSKDVRKDAISMLAEVKLRAYLADVETLRKAVVAVTSVRYPVLERNDIVSRKAASDSAAGTALYRFNIDPADLDFVRGVAQALVSARGPDIAKVKAQIRANVERFIEDETDVPPPFDPAKC